MKTKCLFFGLFLSLCLFFAACNGDDDDNDDASPSADDDSSDDDADDDNADDDVSPPTEYEYEVPVKSTSPWPMYRRTSRNTARSPILPTPSNKDLWAFPTEKGMFHEPVIDEDGTVYMGSADTFFYAINADGTEKWRFATGEIIDSTALIGADSTIYLPAGDGYLYAIDPDGIEKWRVQAELEDAFIPWWEGHMTMGPDGTLYAGNDDRHLYAIDQSGNVLWRYKTYDQIWSCPAVGPGGELYFGANDLIIRSVDTAGERRWQNITLGPIAGSSALSEDGAMLVVGSFDGFVHAFDPNTGKQLWKFAARDHIYATPAFGPDGTIYIGSTDGTMYAINPDGTAKWAFDTLDPIRSSAAIDGDGNIYFGCGDGKVYAMRDDGAKLWSFDTATNDRNDLNGSPAIGPDGIYIGGEAGTLWFIPFGYCETSGDERCETSPDEAIPDDGSFLYYYSNGGSSREDIAVLPVPTEVLTFRLVVRENGDTIRARMQPENLNIAITPNFAHRVEVSADGNFLSIIPEQPLAMDNDYTVALDGSYLTGGWRVGNRIFGGDVGGQFAGGFAFTTAAPTGNKMPLAVTAQQADVLLLRRMAVPQPPMLTTFNQIGFDSYNYLVSTVAVDEASDKFILLTVEGTPGLEPQIYADTKSIFPLDGEALDSYFSLTSEGFALDVTGVSIEMDLFRVSGLLKSDLTSDDLNIYAEVTCSNIEFFGAALNLLGLCHPDTNKLIANGTARIERPIGDMGARPAGIAVTAFDHVGPGGWFGGGYLEATFSTNALMAAEELPVILLIDEAAFTAESLPYGTSLEKLADGQGHLTGVRLHLPSGYDTDGKKAVVILNLYPLAEEAL